MKPSERIAELTKTNLKEGRIDVIGAFITAIVDYLDEQADAMLKARTLNEE